MERREPPNVAIGLQSKRQTYSTLFGAVLGMIIVGLVIPTVFGQPVDSGGDRQSVRFDDGAPLEPTDDTGIAGDSSQQDVLGGDEGGEPVGDPAGPGQDAVGSDGHAAETPREDRSAQDAGDAGDDGATRGASGDEDSSSRPAPTASDTGVTAEAIELGIMLLDLGGIGQVGLSGDWDQEEWYQAHVDHLNEVEGGIHGRRVEPVFAKFDGLDYDSGRAACRRLTQDHEVFAVVAFTLIGDPVLCVVEENATPMINTTGGPAMFYDRAVHGLFTTSLRFDRAFANHAYEAQRLDLLAGRTIGVVTSQGDGYDLGVEEGLVPALRELGHEVAHQSLFSADRAAASSQMPIEVNRMRAAGVDLIFLATGPLYSAMWVQQADRQRYRPFYTAIDIGVGTVGSTLTDFVPESFESISFTPDRTNEHLLEGASEPEFDADCRRAVEQQTGESMRWGDEDDDNYGVAISTCNQVRQFTWGATAAGVELTRQSLVEGLQSLGSFPQASTGGTASLRPGKFDTPDYLRPVQADMDGCECFRPVGPFREMRF